MILIYSRYFLDIISILRANMKYFGGGKIIEKAYSFEGMSINGWILRRAIRQRTAKRIHDRLSSNGLWLNLYSNGSWIRKRETRWSNEPSSGSASNCASSNIFILFRTIVSWMDTIFEIRKVCRKMKEDGTTLFFEISYAKRVIRRYGVGNEW